MFSFDVSVDYSFAEYNGITFNEESNKKDPKFKVRDHIRISNFKNVLLRDIHLIGVKKFV